MIPNASFTTVFRQCNFRFHRRAIGLGVRFLFFKHFFFFSQKKNYAIIRHSRLCTGQSITVVRTENEIITIVDCV